MRHNGAGTNAILAMGGLLLSWAPAALATGVCPTGATYTTDADFEVNTTTDQAASTNVTINNGQVRLSTAPAPMQGYINVACSFRGTVVRMDVDTGLVVGEYWSAPENMLHNPSQTTVDHYGSVWVANRNEYGESPAGSGEHRGSITRIAMLVGGKRCNADRSDNPNGEYLKEELPNYPFTYCSVGDWKLLDRDDDDLIKTSPGLGVGKCLSWANTSGADTHGGVSTAEDELIVNYVRVPGTGSRTLAIDPANDLWSGGYPNSEDGIPEQYRNRRHQKVHVDGITATLVGTPFDVGCGGYGGLFDHDAILWSARPLLRFDPSVPGSQECLQVAPGGQDYGLAVDPVTGHIWASSDAGGVYELDPEDGSILHTYEPGFPGQGIAVDCRSHVWVARVNGDSVLHLAPLDENNPVQHEAVKTITVPPPNSLYGTTGVAVDKNQKIWVTERYANKVSMIDPDADEGRGAVDPNRRIV